MASACSFFCQVSKPCTEYNVINSPTDIPAVLSWPYLNALHKYSATSVQLQSYTWTPFVDRWFQKTTWEIKDVYWKVATSIRNLRSIFQDLQHRQHGTSLLLWQLWLSALLKSEPWNSQVKHPEISQAIIAQGWKSWIYSLVHYHRRIPSNASLCYLNFNQVRSLRPLT